MSEKAGRRDTDSGQNDPDAPAAASATGATDSTDADPAVAETPETTAAERTERPETDPLAASRALLRAIRAGDPFERHERRVASLAEAELEACSTAAQTAFWLNVYNAATQLLMERRPELYGSRLRFFRAEAITVAGTAVSLDAIEHGVLRDAAKYGLGYLPRLFASSFERRHRLPELDPRIHFALNCGAGSCPPIAAYSADVDRELDLAAGGYLDSTAEYDEAAGVVRVPRVCLWYRGDFGGPSGVAAMLREYDVIPADAGPSVEYLAWDWSPDRADFSDLGF